jgi:hypothetical protein
MVLTRPQARVAFDHVISNVMGRGEEGSTLQSALVQAGIVDIFALSQLDHPTIDSLQATTTDDDGVSTTTQVRLADKNLVKCFLDYVVDRNSGDDPIGDRWTDITQADFDAFRISPAYMAARLSTLNIPTRVGGTAARATTTGTGPISTSPAPTKVQTQAELFRRGIKKDPSLFPTLKDEKFNDNWHRSFVNQARAQDVSQVLDASYEASTDEEKELFTEKQKYVYAVLEAKVLTDRGKAIVREHEDDFDAQKVYQKLKEHHLRSTKAMIESSTILSYITSVRLGSGEWQGTTESFILHWQNQVRLYERQVPSSDHFFDGQK